MGKRNIFKKLFFMASYTVTCFVCYVANTVLRFKVEKVPRGTKNYIILFNETRVTNGFIPFLASRGYVHHVVMDYIRGRWYGGMLRAHLYSVFIDQNSPLLAMREIQRRMKRGDSFVLFPEGHYSRNGITNKVSPSTGAFVKTLGHTLVTYRITGGFLRFPTWSLYSRKGPVKGEVAGIYTAEQLKRMTPQEVTDCINRDLYVDEYENQKTDLREYPGRNLAEGIETFLSICPKCRAFGMIRSSGDEFRCTACGMTGRVDKYGFIRSEDFPYTTVPELEKVEDELFDAAYAEAPDDVPFIHFDGVTIEKMSKNYKFRTVAEGVLNVYKDRLEIAGYSFAFASLREIRSMRGVNVKKPQIAVRTIDERYMLSGVGLCTWQIKRVSEESGGHKNNDNNR